MGRRAPKFGPPILHIDTSTWGKRLELRPGIPTVDGGSGLSPDIRRDIRPVSVQVPTATPGIKSRDVTMYATAEPIYTEEALAFLGGGSGFMINELIGTLATGAGGVTRSESFVMPAPGRAIHIGADSVRFSVKYEPAVGAAVPDSPTGLVGWRIVANISTSGLYPGEVRLAPVFSAAATPVTVVIPQFGESFRIAHPMPGLFDVDFQDQFGNNIVGTRNGSQYATDTPLPPAAFQIKLTPLVPVGVAVDTPVLSFRRPS